MKLKFRNLTVIVCFVLIYFTIFPMGCTNVNTSGADNSATTTAQPLENSRVEKVVKDFIKAYNKADVDVMLNLIDPAMAKGIRAVIDLIGIFMKIDMKYVLDCLPLFSALAGNSENYSQMTITDIKSDIDENYAYVYVELEVTSSGTTDKAANTFYLEKIDDNWYIMDFS